MPARSVRQHRQPRLTKNERRISADLLAHGRFANTLYQAAGAIGLARKRGVEPAFLSSYIYREWLSMPDDWFLDDLSGTIPAHVLATNLPSSPRIYLQDLSLWSHCWDEVMAALAPSPEAQTIIDHAWNAATLSEEFPRPYVGVHVRRGDTATRNPPDSINPLPASYYLDAIERSGASTVFVASDDHEWCLRELASVHPVMLDLSEPGPEDWESDFLTRPRTDWIDCELLARFDALVIANSSYSAWAGYKRRGGVPVFYPGRWFGDLLIRRGNDESRFVQPEWTRVPVIED